MNTVYDPHSATHSRGFLYFLLYTAFTCGSLIMVVEVLGSRVIGPFFGVSLFVWTSLISVAMISLALGYALGGFVADKRPSSDNLYWIILLAGVCVIVIPLIKKPILKMAIELGLRGGAFTSSLILFGPVLLFLGCVSPFLIKIVAREVTNIGRTVGSFYAISTIGSVFGTAITGFLLISLFSVRQIFFLVGTILIVSSVFYFVGFRKKKKYLFALLILVTLPFLSDRGTVAKRMDNGTMVRLVEQESSHYGDVKVVDYSYGSTHHRELIIDGMIQGGVDMGNQLPYYPYAYLLTHLPLHIHPGGQNALVIGLGAGIIPRWFEQLGVITDVVDIDEDVVDMAREHFGFENRGTVHIEDARYFLGRNEKQYDYIILDVFNGDTTPGHIVSYEAFELIEKNLTPNGVMGMNFIATIRGDNLIAASVVKTMKSVFDNVVIYANFDPASEDEGNLSIIAYNGPYHALSSDIFDNVRIHPMAAQAVRSFSRYRISFDEPEQPWILLTDDFNPMDSYDIELKEEVRRDILASTDWAILLY